MFTPRRLSTPAQARYLVGEQRDLHVAAQGVAHSMGSDETRWSPTPIAFTLGGQRRRGVGIWRGSRARSSTRPCLSNSICNVVINRSSACSTTRRFGMPDDQVADQPS